MKRTSKNKSEPLKTRLATGLTFGAVFSMFVPLILLGALVEGAWEFRARTTLVHAGVLALTYPLGAMLAGTLFMFLQPHLRWTPLAMLWGSLSMVPWVAGIALATDRGYDAWTSDHTFMVAIVSLPLGAALGYGLRDSSESTQESGAKKGDSPSS